MLPPASSTGRQCLLEKAWITVLGLGLLLQCQNPLSHLLRLQICLAPVSPVSVCVSECVCVRATPQVLLSQVSLATCLSVLCPLCPLHMLPQGPEVRAAIGWTAAQGLFVVLLRARNNAGTTLKIRTGACSWMGWGLRAGSLLQPPLGVVTAGSSCDPGPRIMALCH